MNSPLISQIVLVIMSVVLIMMYIRPGVDQVRSLQDEQAQLESALETASEFARALQQLESEVGTIDPTDLEAVNTYLPDEADKLSAMWTLDSIAKEAGVSLASISIVGQGDSADTAANNSIDQTGLANANQQGVTLNVDVNGTYSGFKAFLKLLEVNEFPFLTQKLTIGSAAETEGAATTVGTGKYSLSLLVPEYQEETSYDSSVDDTLLPEEVF